MGKKSSTGKMQSDSKKTSTKQIGVFSWLKAANTLKGAESRRQKAIKKATGG